MLAGSSLVNRKEIVLIKDLLHLRGQAPICGAPGICVITYHHCAELLIRHRVDAAVGEHIEITFIRIHAVGIEACAADSLDPLLNGKDRSLLHDANLMHLQRK